MVLNAAFELMDTGHFGNIALSSAVLKAVLLTTNATELIHLNCTLFKEHLPTELARMMLEDP